MTLTEDVSRTQVRAWTMGIRAASKHAAGTPTAVGETDDQQAPLIVPVVVKGNLTTFNISNISNRMGC